MEKRYNTMEEVCKEMPWAAKTVAKLVARGFLQGKENGHLDLSEDMIRLLVINDRAGLYGEPVN